MKIESCWLFLFKQMHEKSYFDFCYFLFLFLWIRLSIPSSWLEARTNYSSLRGPFKNDIAHQLLTISWNFKIVWLCLNWVLKIFFFKINLYKDTITCIPSNGNMVTLLGKNMFFSLYCLQCFRNAFLTRN